ncbi:hypothetical protein [Herbaspirillum sp. CF444]|uniref:hypothetical protein n=1 Tax=Herbaspirillum sp. CF444 TaxID=1144319 RepID=UPI001ED8F344|nr:hypothetical protein [Herbaspirillum sp. CF444]
MIAQHINCGRFAGIGATGEGNLGYLSGWQITEMIHRGEETGLPKLGHSRGNALKVGKNAEKLLYNKGLSLVVLRWRKHFSGIFEKRERGIVANLAIY